MYFIVDGSHTETGTTYTLTVKSGGMTAVDPVATNQGTEEDPVQLLQGVLFRTASVATFSYYQFPVTPGTTYWVNTYGDVTTHVYSDRFQTEVGSPVTPSSDTLYVKVEGTILIYELEAVTSDGTLSAPLPLYVEKTNWNQVGAGSSSYYIFKVTSDINYTVKASWLSNDVDLFVYDSSNFTNLAASAETGDDPETCSVTPTSGYITVRVDDKSVSGATFLLKVFQP
jgi:hypothetical protein